MEARSDPGTGAPARARAPHLGPEQRRPSVLDAALRLVASDGATATTMEAIATEAGVTKPVVYACYSSKRELMSALLHREELRLVEHMSASLPDAPGIGEVEESLTAGFLAFLSAVASHPDSYRVVFMSGPGPERVVQRSLERARLAQNRRIAELVRDGMQARGIDRADAKAQVVASVVMGACEGAVKLLLAEPDDWSPGELAELMARVLARGLGGLGLT